MKAECWKVGMLEWLIAAGIVVLSIIPSFHLSAQHVAIGPQIVFGDYREVSANLRYRGSGIGAAATVSWRKFGATVLFSKLQYKPVDDPFDTFNDFDATEIDLRLRYSVAGPVSAEIGFLRREADPEFEAQSVAAVTAGGRMAYLLGPGVRMALTGGLLFGSKFSGGGSTGALGALQLGLGLTVDALRGRVQATGDYGFQRFSRETNDGSGAAKVPIQQSVARVGFAIAF